MEFGSFSQNSSYTPQPPWHASWWLRGGVILVAFLLLGGGLVWREWREGAVERARLGQLENSASGAMDHCKKAKDPDVCKTLEIQRAVSLGASVKWCADLEGEARDGCLIAAARRTEDTGICKDLDSEFAQGLCTASVVNARVDKAVSERACDALQEPELVTACTNELLNLIGGQGCEAVGLNPALCADEMLLSQPPTDTDGKALCDRMQTEIGKQRCENQFSE